MSHLQRELNERQIRFASIQEQIRELALQRWEILIVIRQLRSRQYFIIENNQFVPSRSAPQQQIQQELDVQLSKIQFIERQIFALTDEKAIILTRIRQLTREIVEQPAYCIM
jgi:hypothetical protein